MKKVSMLFLFLFYLCSWAQEHTMTINFNDGGTLILPLDEIETMTFEEMTDPVHIETAQKVISQFTLLQNYPNPFNLCTRISFVLPENGDAEISIFNVNGKLVKALYSGMLTEGNHELPWNGQDENGNIVASGVYFYQVNFENEIISKKMILVK